MQSAANQSPHPNSLLTGNLTGNFADSGLLQHFSCLAGQQIQRLAAKFPTHQNREFPDAYQGKFFEEQGICILIVSVHSLHACFAPAERDLFSLAFLQKWGGTDGGRMAASRALRRTLLARAPRGVASKRFESARVL
jgi:hypothetical protein